MRASMLALAGLMTLTALPAAAQSDREPYKAVGTEPFWSVTIGSSTMRYESPNARPVTVAKPRPIIGFNGERYVTRGLTVDIVHMECNDGMSERTFHDTVTVTLGRRTLKGCGGAVLSEAPRVTLLEGDWLIETLDGRRVASQTRPSVSFRGDRINGNGGCNRFNGSFRFARGRLNAGPLATTRMACVLPAQNLQETNILQLLGTRLTVSKNRAGKPVLTAPGGRAMVLGRERRR